MKDDAVLVDAVGTIPAGSVELMVGLGFCFELFVTEPEARLLIFPKFPLGMFPIAVIARRRSAHSLC